MSSSAIGERKYQDPCVDGILKAWNLRLPAIVTAMTGAGKTYITAKAIQKWQTQYVFVICPKSIKYKWRDLLTTFIPQDRVAVFSYETWRNCGSKEYLLKKQPYTWRVEQRKAKGKKVPKKGKKVRLLSL